MIRDNNMSKKEKTNIALNKEKIKSRLEKRSFLHKALNLSERILSVEIELKNQRELMMNRFEAIDKRFEDMQKYMDKRFEDMDKRFNMLLTFISIGFVIMGVLMSVYKFID